MILSIDIETYSSVNLLKTGVYPYIASPDFQILMLAYSIDGKPVEVLDLTKDSLPPFWMIKALKNPEVTKTAWNAAFERLCLSKHLGIELPVEQWDCTMVRAARAGYPLQLGQAAKAMGLDQEKDTAGKALIKYFSVPCTPTKKNGGRTRNMPSDDPEKWAQYIEYNRQDVVVEMAIRDQIAKIPVTEFEKRLYCLDQKINDTGILVDVDLVTNAVRIQEEYVSEITREATEITGLENPNSVKQLSAWLNENGQEVEKLRKEDVSEMLSSKELAAEVRRILQIRQEASKSSVKKYEAMLAYIGADNRVRGLFQFYGANRTGRWCLTGDHEVLTRTGWVRLDQWPGGVIACWNPSNEVISFQKAEANAFNYQGEMILIDSQRCFQLSTPDHKMAVWTEKGWQSEKIENLAKRFLMAFTGKRNNVQRFEENQLRFLIMTQADGHFTEDGDLRFHFTKLRKVERCKMILRRCGIPFISGQTGKSIRIVLKQRDLPLFIRMFKPKVFGQWMLDENADVIIDELEHWDAYRCGPNSIQYTSCIKENVDIIQAICTLSGRSCTVVTKHENIENWNTSYVANIWLTPGRHTAIRKEYQSRQLFDGEVFCPTTSTGFFMVRRGGRVWVTGNSGRGVQFQNLPQNHLDHIELAREVVKENDGELLHMLWKSVPDTLSQLIRTAFIPKEGHVLIISDFSAIEARVIAWLAGEQWRLDVFATHGKIYEASASKMFNVPIEQITKGSDLRQKGKVAELALGYGGGPNALIAMGALKQGVAEDELPMIVKRWRASNPAIIKLWNDLENAAIRALELPGQWIKCGQSIQMIVKYKTLFIELPSGRRLSYLNAKLAPSKFGNGKMSVVYQGMEQVKKIWIHQDTYGGKLTENVVQAIARDCLAEALIRLDDAGYMIVTHVHDEVVLEVPEGHVSVESIDQIMSTPMPWAIDLLLKAEGFEAKFYQK